MLPERHERADPRTGVAARGLAIGCLGLLVGCASGVEPMHSGRGTEIDGPEERPSQNAVVNVPGGEPLVPAPEQRAGASQSDAPGPSAPDPGVDDDAHPRAPEGYVEMTVVGVAPTEDGDAVLLVDADRSVIVPIFVGNTEALAIGLRHRKERFARPLTHDLLDSVMRELGGTLVKVHVDDIKGKTFVGAVFIRAAGRLVEIDARPSDAIALALGSRVPIFVAKRVVLGGGIRKDVTPGGATPIEVPHI